MNLSPAIEVFWFIADSGDLRKMKMKMTMTMNDTWSDVSRFPV